MSTIAPGDALASGHVDSKDERAKMIELIGITVMRLYGPEPFAEGDRMMLLYLIGMVAARLHESALTARLATIEYQLAALQRERAAPS